MPVPIRLALVLLFVPVLLNAQPANHPPTLLSDLVDVSRDFRDYTNAYYVADTLAGFDPANARDPQWQRAFKKQRAEQNVRALERLARNASWREYRELSECRGEEAGVD